MPKICYIDKSFKPASLELIEKVNNVVEEYQDQGYSLTLRQVYYQMVARDIIPNNQRSYKNLGSLINDARLAGLVDWEAIEDRTRNLRSRSHWRTPGGVIQSAAHSYHLDYWEGQENYVEVWVEKDALVGIVGQVCERLDVNYFSCRGYVSQSEMWSAGGRLRRRYDMGQNLVLLHLGDHDPSGKDMSRDIQERLELFGAPNVQFHRVALNMDQIEQYDPPPNPAKLSDSRAEKYIDEYGDDSWELDALEPQVISDIIQHHVEQYRDDSMYREILRQESREKELLKDVAKYWDTVADNWDDIRREYE